MFLIDFDSDKLIKSPLNYTGGKFKLLPQILPLLPDNINTFVDMFGGGFNMGINIKADKIIYNDTLTQVVDLLYTFEAYDKEQILTSILSIINGYGLSKVNKESYLELRKQYNITSNCNEKDIMFYTLVCYSFSNQIRFNSKNGYNMPFGEREFNTNMRNNLDRFLNKLHSINVEFVNKDFTKLSVDKLGDNDFVYCDPPYLITCASYNEQDGWNEEKEKELLSILDSLNDNGVKFALSNVLESKGKSNDILKEWSEKYIIHKLNCSYGNASYQRKDKSKNTSVEVLITNY